MRRPWARLAWLALLASEIAIAQPAPPDVDPDAAPVVTPDADVEEGKDGKGKDGKGKDGKGKGKGKKASRKPKISGYLQVRYRQPFDTNDDGVVRPGDFRLQRVRVKVNGTIVDHVGYSVEIDPRAPDITGILRDAYVRLTYIPHHEVRIGQQKTQFGYENVISSTRLYTVNRSEVSDVLARGVTLRDIGIGVVGEIPIGCGFSIEDAVTVVNGAGANVQADNNRGKDVWGRIGGRYDNKRIDLEVKLGVSGAYGTVFDPGLDPVSTVDDYRGNFKRVGVDLQVDHTRGFLAAEYVWGRDTDGDTGNKVDASGYYVTVAGKTPWRVGPIVRYDTLEDYKRYTFGGFWGARSAPLRAMINYEHRVDRDDRLLLWGQAKF
jgi:hypothetical protein